MAYTETTTTGYGTRVGRSFKSIGSGFVMFCLATALLWWNEGRAVKTDKMLNDAEAACVDMENPNKIDPAMEGELVCASALATTEDVLTDDKFGFSETAIGMSRRVEYYQWVEHAESKSEDKLGGKEVTTTTYTYTTEWTNAPVNSTQFKDPAYQSRNFTIAQVEDGEQWAENVKFGAYKLPESLFHSMSSREAVVLNLNADLLTQFDKAARDVDLRINGNKAVTTTASQPAQVAEAVEAVTDSVKTVVSDSIPQENKVDLDYVHQQGNVLYIGRTPAAPQVGDVRVTFEKIVPAKVTIIAKVKGDTFTKFKAKNGKTFQTLVMGVQDSAEIFESEHAANNMWLWMLRILGIMLVIAGLKGIFGFLETILKVVPFIANIFGWGVGVVCTVVGVVWSLIVIALAWLFYRPLLGIALLALAGFLIWVFAFKGKDKLKELAAKAKKPEVQPQPIES